MPETKRTGKVIVIVAPSGSGKTTIARLLLRDLDQLKFSTSATTRKPREGETNGNEYFFLSHTEFEELVKKDGFLEWENYSGNRYGTLRSEVDKLIESGYFPLLDIEVKGALNVKKMYGSECITIFIKPPSLTELEQRLLKRKSETEKSRTLRLKQAKQEMGYANRFDYVVINDNLKEAYNIVKEIIRNFIS